MTGVYNITRFLHHHGVLNHSVAQSINRVLSKHKMTAIKTPDKSLYRRLLSYALVHKWYLAVSVFGFALFAAMEATLVKTVEYFIRFLQNQPSEPLLTLPSVVTSSLYFVPAAVVVLSVFRGAGSFLGNYFMSRIGVNVVTTLRKQVFEHMLYLPQSYYDRRNSGELISLVIYNIDQVTQTITESIKILLRDGFLVVGILTYLLYYNWKLTLIFIVVVPILGAIIYAAGRYFRKKSRKIQDSMGQIAHISTETFQGIKLVKSYLGEQQEHRRFNRAADNNLQLQTKYQRAKALQTPVLHVIIAIALAVIFFLVMKFWPDNDSARAVAYVSFAGMIAKPFRQLATLNAVIQKGMAAAETIFSTIDAPPEKNSGQKQLQEVRGQVDFDNVCFAYNGEVKAIEQLSLSIQPGETVAIVGATGSGKSTIASLLLRFYDANSGRIKIDGIPIKELSIESLRSNIALVNQQTVLLNDTIKANIAYGRDLASTQIQDIEQAATDAFAKPFIEELEQGFETCVGEGGSSLSGGQRQRLAIARGLLKNAPILILDEATSALDNESEKQVQIALERLKKGRTTIIIAHRLSTIENADRIIVLDRGHIVEEGSHRELLARGGAYAELHNAQTKEKA